MFQAERSEEELALAARDGEEEAFAQLFFKLLPMARRKALQRVQDGVELEDLIQEGMIGLLDAVRRFDGSMGVSFSAFASVCMERRILSACRVAFGLRQRLWKESVPLGEEEEFPAPDVQEPETAVVQREDYRNLVEKIFAALSEFEHRVWSLFLQGYSYERIAKILECGEKSVDNAMQRVRRKLRSVVGS